MTVWDSVVGQDDAVATLRAAVAEAHSTDASDPSGAMTHAWLITGPPGSGRSVAAVAFATALVCEEGGCGTCRGCRDVTTGMHSDVTVVRPAGVIMGVEQTRGLIGRISVMPMRSDWNVIVIEDADRLNEHADNTLLKSLEEPPPRGVWILCAPSPDDVLPTIRSRCRVVRLRTPPAADVAEFLVSAEGADPAIAAFAARASQGHIGRARALVTDADARSRHQDLLRLPFRLGSVAACVAAAEQLVAAAKERAHAIAEPLERDETAALMQAAGDGATGAGAARSRVGGALRELEKEQRNRRRRLVRDELDRMLVDLLGLYRDVLAVTSDAPTDLINAEVRAELEVLAGGMEAAGVLHRIAAISHARAALAADGSEILLMTELTLSLQRPGQERVRPRTIVS